MNPCQRLRDWLFDLLDGELDILRKKELDSHLKTCSHCNRFLNQLRLLRSHCKNLTPIKTSEGFHILLRERIRREIAGKKDAFAPSVSFSIRWIPAFGIMLVVIIAGFWMIDRKTTFLPLPGTRESVVQPAVTSQKDFDGQVQYVIDDYPARVSISRDTSNQLPSGVSRDSLLHKQRQERVQQNVVPVSF